jgi:hypothetical protein
MLLFDFLKTFQPILRPFSPNRSKAHIAIHSQLTRIKNNDEKQGTLLNYRPIAIITVLKESKNVMLFNGIS